MSDLFGIAELERAMTPAERRKMRGPTPKRGHAQPPGSGPAGETCGTCKHICRKRLAKTYIKCGLNEKNWTGGPGSDIRVHDAACRLWEGA